MADSKVVTAVKQVVGNILYNGVEKVRDGKEWKRDKKGAIVTQPKQNVHLVVFDPTIRGGMTDHKTGQKYSHCATLPINVAEVLAKVANMCCTAGEPEAFALALTTLCQANRAKRNTLAPSSGSSKAAPVFLTEDDES